MTSKEEYATVLDKICNRMLCGGECSVGEGKCELLETIEKAIIKAVKYEELTHQPSFEECVKEWEDNYGVLQNNEYYLEVIDEWNVRILIDKKTKRYQCYSVSDDIRRLETPMLVEIDAHHLLSKTLKALEEMKDGN